MTGELDRAHCSHDNGRGTTHSGGDTLLIEEEGSEYLLAII